MTAPAPQTQTPRPQRTASALVLALLLLLPACSGPPQTTRTETDDFIVMSEQIAAAMLNSEAIAERRPDSEPWVVVADRFENLSSEVITPAEQKSIVRRIIAAAPLDQLSQQKNITFVITWQETQGLSEPTTAGVSGLAAARNPTHTLTVTFRSATRAQAKSRTDAYFIEYELTDLRDGTRVWQGDVGYKRAARGHIWD
ncbi:hypothetical protein [Mucisphaera calidilacus]|uniref:Penicillin-binding protein activator LpoB n=1 Tax=Mucisphaera calidilacus TaxID=2527982 RepID=A0A518BTE1_9BACT|nr:hypothetical protein [Mucisphaera calidilacus]QDU70240.1 hypothetical protein Pan265_00620 [Mucisphaera calidilacus]